MKGNKNPDVPGYIPFSKNRKGRNGGGISTLVKVDQRNNTLKVSEGKDGMEFMVTRHSQFQVPINIVKISMVRMNAAQPKIRLKKTGMKSSK